MILCCCPRRIAAAVIDNIDYLVGLVECCSDGTLHHGRLYVMWRIRSIFRSSLSRQGLADFLRGHLDFCHKDCFPALKRG